jgi:FixJ family two-component response regulator
MTEPVLTPAEERIADALADGQTCVRVASWLGLKKKTVYVHIMNIAGKLKDAGLNPNDIKPYQLVSRWAFERRQKRKLSA